MKKGIFILLVFIGEFNYKNKLGWVIKYYKNNKNFS